MWINTATFGQRIEFFPVESPVAFTDDFANDHQKKVQWKAFLLRKSKLGKKDGVIR